MLKKIALTSIALLLAGAVFAPAANATGPAATVVSVSSPEQVAGPFPSGLLVDVTADGRSLLYYRLAPRTDLPGFFWYQPFVRNLTTGAEVLLSTQDVTGFQSGTGAPRVAQDSFTADGTKVLFSGPNGRLDASLAKPRSNDLGVYVRNLITGDNQLVDVSTAGVGANRNSDPNGISSDGRYVVFSSEAINLVTNPVGFDPTNASILFYYSTYIRDLVTGVTREVAPGAQYFDGVSGTTLGGSSFRAMSPNGRFIVVAHRGATWIYDVEADIYERFTLTGGDLQSRVWDISDDGRLVAFTSRQMFSSDDSTAAHDAYVIDRSTGSTTFISRSTDGIDGLPICGFAVCHSRTGAISDLRFVGSDGLVAFSSQDRLVAEDPAAARPLDYYVRDTVSRTTMLVSSAPAGPNAYVTSDIVTTDSGDAILFRTRTAESGAPATFWRVDIARTPADAVPPVVTGSADFAPNANGWSPLGTTITWASVDPEPSSGTATVPAPTVVATEGENQTITSEPSCDPAGNCSTGTFSISVDATPPLLSASTSQSPSTAAGWFTTDVEFTWSCSDSLSGIDGSCPEATVVGGEGEGLTTSATVSDRAGNSASATSEPVRIDRTAPVTDVTAPEGWTNQSVTLDLVATDNLSGVAQTFARVDGGETQEVVTVTIAGQGSHTVEYWSVDNAGNIESVKTATVWLEFDGPDVVASVSPQPNAAGWNNSPVTITTVCSDALSGITACSGAITLNNDGANQTVQVSGTDGAGNTSSLSVTVNIDSESPLVEVVGASSNGVYPLESAPSPTCSTSDVTSGVATPAALTLSRAINGVYTVQCDGATDAADNAAESLSFTYRVVPSEQSLLALTYAYIDQGKATNKRGAKTSVAVLLRVNPCAYISRVMALQSSGTLTSAQASELIYWARVLSPTCTS